MTTSPKPAAETDADRDAQVIAGRIAPKRQSSAPRTAAASRPAAKTASKPAAGRPAKSAPKAAPKPAKSDELTDRDRQRIVMSALITAAANMLDTWNDPRVTQTAARDFLRQRLQYTGWRWKQMRCWPGPHPVRVPEQHPYQEAQRHGRPRLRGAAGRRVLR